MRALIIDDSKTMRRYLALIAAGLAFASEEAANGVEALRLMRRHAFDVALVDWDMPGMNGIEFVEQVRARPDYDRTKLLMITARSSFDAVSEALDKGADDFLMKPVTEEMVAEKLRVLGLLL